MKSRRVYVRKKEALDPCPVEHVFHLVAARWKARTLFYLGTGRHGFSELRRRLPGVSREVLATQLSALVQDGLVAVQREWRGKRQLCRYELTDLGRSLLPVLDQISAWGLAQFAEKGITWNESL